MLRQQPHTQLGKFFYYAYYIDDRWFFVDNLHMKIKCKYICPQRSRDRKYFHIKPRLTWANINTIIPEKSEALKRYDTYFKKEGLHYTGLEIASSLIWSIHVDSSITDIISLVTNRNVFNWGRIQN